MVNIKNQPVESDGETAVIYVPMFQTGSPETLLKFFTIIHKIIRGKDLSTGPQKFGMTQNLVVGESLRVFGQKAQDRATKKIQTMSW